MKQRQLQLSLLKDKYGICTLPNNAPIPDWALTQSLASITRTEKELTIVCRNQHLRNLNLRHRLFPYTRAEPRTNHLHPLRYWPQYYKITCIGFLNSGTQSSTKH